MMMKIVGVMVSLDILCFHYYQTDWRTKDFQDCNIDFLSPHLISESLYALQCVRLFQ